MKELFTLSFFCTFMIYSAVAQYAQNSLGVGAVDYIEMEANPNGSLDITDGFTFEAWIYNQGGGGDQKIGGKIGPNFLSGFIFGIENFQVKMEVFDDEGTNTVLTAGMVSGIGWTHVAGTYEVGGMSRIFINGELAGETPASSVAVSPNGQPFRIAIAPWDVNALGFAGFLDEVCYWQAVLDEETIKEWMHKTADQNHPNIDALGVYYNFDAAEGTVVEDLSPNENFGIFNDELLLEPAFLPFKGDFELYENEVQGIWNAQTANNSDILFVEGVFFDSLDIMNSVLMSTSVEGYGIEGISIAGSSSIEFILEKKWRVATQGELFANILFDLSPLSQDNFFEVALFESEDDDFTDATRIDGVFDYTIAQFLVEEAIFIDGYYYTLGFNAFSSTRDKNKKDFELTVSPNPGSGLFQIQVSADQIGEVQLNVMDVTGRSILRKTIQPAALSIQETLDLGNCPSGMYLLEISSETHYGLEKIMINH